MDMDISWAVRCHITYCVKAGDMFTTRELLRYGNRNAIDQVTFRLVKAGIIIRLAWGVFVRQEDYEDNPLPSPMEVARVKARAFCREIYMLAEEMEETIAAIIESTRDNCQSNNGSKNDDDSVGNDNKNIADNSIDDNSFDVKAIKYESRIEEWQKKNNDNLKKMADYARYGKARKMHGLLAEDAPPPEKLKMALTRAFNEESDRNSSEYSGEGSSEYSGENLPENLSEDFNEFPTLTFATDGHSTSFYYGTIKIALKSIAPRKRFLKDTAAGVLIRLAWSLGETWVNNNSLWGQIKGEKTKQLLKKLLRRNIEILPSWMTEALFSDLRPGSEYQGNWQRPAPNP